VPHSKYFSEMAPRMKGCITIDVIFEVLMAVKLEFLVFWVVMPCNVMQQTRKTQIHVIIGCKFFSTK
jgi:hypothetical protein